MRYVGRRVILFILTLWAAITLNFILPRLMPGSPVDAALAKLAAAGQPITDSVRKAIEIQLGSPSGNIFSQYGQYLVNIVHLDFGRSYTFPTQSVAKSIGDALPWTLVLVGVTTIVAFVVGTLLGVLAGGGAAPRPTRRSPSPPPSSRRSRRSGWDYCCCMRWRSS